MVIYKNKLWMGFSFERPVFPTTYLTKQCTFYVDLDQYKELVSRSKRV
jgi:hypothetical protein